MMAGNPNWWANLFPPSFAEQPHQSWSQLLLGDEDHRVLNQTQIINPSPIAPPNSHHTNKFLHFSSHTATNLDDDHNINQQPALVVPGAAAAANYSPESNPFFAAVAAGTTACKKARVHPPSSSQPPLKVRKEKLVDRVTVLHQIVSPFGKTDTASVLSEAIGYIRFLQGQIEAFSYPYLRSAPKDLRNSQPVEMMSQEEPLKEDLRSRGLCLVPISCTQLVGGGDHSNDNNAAAYWAPAYGSTGF